VGSTPIPSTKPLYCGFFVLVNVHCKCAETLVSTKVGADNTLSIALREYEVHQKAKITFESIDSDFYASSTRFFEKEKKYKRNTIQTQFRILKTIMAESLDLGYHTNNRPRKFVAPADDVSSVYLNEKELTELYKLDLSNSPRLDKVRDLFIINCYTGSRFGDLQHINIKNITADHLIPDHQYLTYKQNKTGSTVSIPVPAQLTELLVKYNNELPKPPRNQK
jgi:integrase